MNKVAELPDLTKLLALIGNGTDQSALNAARKQLIDSQPVDSELIKESNKQIEKLKAAYVLANAARSGGAIDPADKAIAGKYRTESIGDGIQVYVDKTTGLISLDINNQKEVLKALEDQLKAYGSQISTLEGVVRQAQAAPAANADATLKGLQGVLLTTGVNDLARTQRLEDEKIARDLRLGDAAAAANRAKVELQEGTVATMIVQDPKDGQWYFRQILKNGKFTDSLYNPSDADRAKALYNAPDGSIGSIGADGTSVKWTYRPPRLTKNGEFTYSTEFDPLKQDYVGAQTTISGPGQKLEMYNGQLYVTEIKDGKITATKVENVPSMSEKDRQDLDIASRNSATAEKNQVLAAAESGIKVDTAKFALESAKEGKQNAVEILAGRMTVIQGLIKSGTAADLAKAQELYQSARKDWEVEKKNATDRRDKAQDKGLRRSGMMFLRGATAVQGGKTGADAQKMWKEEYNRTPGKEGETYSERMARSLGLGADLDQNLDTTFPTFTEFANKGSTANVVPAPKPVVPAVVAPTAAAETSKADGKVPPVFNPNVATTTAIATRPSGTITGNTNAAGYQTDTFPTVSSTGAGPGDVPAQSLNQGQVAVAPNSISMPPWGYQTGMNAAGSYAPMQVNVPDVVAPLPASWKQYTPENYQNIQGSTQEGDVNVNDEDPMTKLTRLHSRLNGFSAE